MTSSTQEGVALTRGCGIEGVRGSNGL